MIRRIVGFILVLIGLLGIGLSVAGNRAGLQALDEMGTAVSDTLTLTSQSLDLVQETLLLTKESIAVVSRSLNTVEQAALGLSGAIVDTLPLVNELAEITSQDLPNSLEALQETLPNVTQAAKVIDDALETLNRFRFEETIPLLNYTISWNLGVNYNPTVPFDVAVMEIGNSLEPLPGRLRVLEAQILLTSANLQGLSNDVALIAADLTAVNEQVNALNPLLDEYIATVILINDTSRQTRASLNAQLESLKIGITWFMIWLALFQIVPFYLGYELITGHLFGLHAAKTADILPATGKDA